MIYIKHIQYMKKSLVIEQQLKVLLVVKENYNMKKYYFFKFKLILFIKVYHF